MFVCFQGLPQTCLQKHLSFFPSAKKPNHQSEEIKSDFRIPSIRCVIDRKSQKITSAWRMLWAYANVTAGWHMWGPRSADPHLPAGSQALLCHLGHGYARTRCSCAILPGTFSSEHSLYDCQGLPAPVVFAKLQLTLRHLHAVWEVHLRPRTSSDGFLGAGMGQK